MKAVLTDLALESEAATAIALRVAASFDRAASDPQEAAFMRLATPVAKYWVCKRQPGFVYEALECLGGAGYVEEGPMPRLYRQSPLNAIWEGSGNVIALDILRAIGREPESLEAVLHEVDSLRGASPLYDSHIDALKDQLGPGQLHEGTARRLAQQLALALQGAALHASAPDYVFEGFCLQRLDPVRRGLAYGDVAGEVNQDAILTRAMPG